MPRRVTPIATAETPIGVGDPVIVPDPQALQIAIPAGTVDVQLIVGIDAATKLADGVLVDFTTNVSHDSGASWTFVNGGTWQSYGPGGYTSTDIDGNVTVNPDPLIEFPAHDKNGFLVRVTVNANQVMTVTLSMRALS